MLQTISDLLREMQQAEANALAETEITHPGVIGEMYEGLTSEILELPLTEESGIRVTNGFLQDNAGNLSRQIDCIVAHGTGKKVAYTSREVVPIENAILAVEVKKTLYTAELEQSYANLLSVRTLESSTISLAKLLEQAFQSITGHPLPRTAAERLAMSAEVRAVFDSLVQDVRLPVRVVLGYDGFASEQSMRSKFIEFLEGRLNIPGYGPASLPTLVVSGQFSILKANGMPHAIGMHDGKWELLVSSNRNPLFILLELLFCRLNFMNVVGCEIFGEDLKQEAANRFVSVSVTEQDGRVGWAYSYLGDMKDEGAVEDHDLDWSPVFVDEVTHEVLKRLCQGAISVSNPWLLDHLRQHNRSLGVLVQQLRDSRLAGVAGEELRLLTQSCRCCALPDGRFVAGEDFSGRLSRWVSRFINGRRD